MKKKTFDGRNKEDQAAMLFLVKAGHRLEYYHTSNNKWRPSSIIKVPLETGQDFAQRPYRIINDDPTR